MIATPATGRARAGLTAAGLLAVAAAGLLQARPTAARDTSRPALLVVLVADQFRMDYIDRYGHEWTGGLRRLIDHGAVFPRAEYLHYSTVTCSGHATIGTGAVPATHGMVLNEWWDRAAGVRVPCASDEGTSLVSYGPALDGSGQSAWRLRVSTLADELRAQPAEPARVMTFSLKARSAIMLAGQQADAVVWFDDRGAFTTSTAWSDTPVPAVADFIWRHPVEGDLGRTWDRLLPLERYLFESPAVGIRPSSSFAPAFPHALEGREDAPDSRFLTRWRHSPFSDAYLGAMALHAARAAGLGTSARTDYLGIGFSALDLVGHIYGPRSHEVQDLLIRLDRTIGDLLQGLDEFVGGGNYVVAFSADHGVAPIPEYASSVGLRAGRRPAATIAEAIEEALAPLGPGRHVAMVLYTDAYLSDGTWARLRGRPDLVDRVKARLATLEGVAAVYTRDEIAAGRFPAGSVGARMARGYHPDRSGDFLIALDPYWMHQSSGTTHGTGYAYDARVPVVLMGKAIVPGNFTAAASPADIAPTLAYLSGITLPFAQGRVLVEALAPGARAATDRDPAAR